MPKLEEGRDKSRGGCPNPDDRGTRSYPVKHHAEGLTNRDRHNPHASKDKGRKKST